MLLSFHSSQYPSVTTATLSRYNNLKTIQLKATNTIYFHNNCNKQINNGVGGKYMEAAMSYENIQRHKCLLTSYECCDPNSIHCSNASIVSKWDTIGESWQKWTKCMSSICLTPILRIFSTTIFTCRSEPNPPVLILLVLPAGVFASHQDLSRSS